MKGGENSNSDAESGAAVALSHSNRRRRRTRHQTSGSSSHASSLENTPTKPLPPTSRKSLSQTQVRKQKSAANRLSPASSMASHGGRLKIRQHQDGIVPGPQSGKVQSRLSLASKLTKHRVNKALRHSLQGAVSLRNFGISNNTTGSPDSFSGGAQQLPHRNFQPPPRYHPRRGSPTLAPSQRCAVHGCDSRGHLSGRLPWHSTPASCPLYHNVTAEKCVAMAEERVNAMLSSATAQETTSTLKKLRLSTRAASPEKVYSSSNLKRLKYLRVQSAAALAADPGAALGSSPSAVSAVPIGSSPTSSTRAASSTVVLRQPGLDGLSVLPCDRDLFLQSQAAAVEDVGFEQALTRAIVPPPPPPSSPEQKTKSTKSSSKTGPNSDLNPNYRLKWIVLNGVRIAPWYPSPYPDEYIALDTLFVCEFCFRYFRTEAIYRRHQDKCVWRHPPGDEIYRKDDHSIFEIDGNAAKQYCQNLCLFAKLFIANKTLFYEVETFLFYVLTKNDPNGCHAMGYFSKEKHSLMNCNLSCLLVFPSQSRRGYGKFLIDFSYLLSRLEGRIGSPERPLSDLGLLSYRSYWKEIIVKYLGIRMESKSVSIKDISDETGIHRNDIVSTLQVMGIIKYWKHRNIILKHTDLPKELARLQHSKKEKHHQHPNMQGFTKPFDWHVDASCLKWTPRNRKQIFGMPMAP